MIEDTPNTLERRLPWRIALADDSRDFRGRLAARFRSTPGWDCIAEWSRPGNALDGIVEARPDLLLLDVRFPGAVQGDAIVGTLRQRCPGLLIVMLTVSDDADVVFRSLRDGAVGYVLKTAGWTEILAGAEDALLGGSPMSRAVARQVRDEFARLTAISSKPNALTSAERQVLERCAMGETEAQIADALGKSRFTVRAQFRSILNRLDATTRAQAVAEAVRRGWM